MKQNAPFAAALVVAAVFFGYMMMSSSGAGTAPAGAAAATATVENGTQVVSLTAKGGYAPALTNAKAGIPTVLRVSTSGTYDCSSALRVPSLGVSERLPATGQTDIDLGTPEAGTLQGTCSMGMYRFAVNFN
ncbi:MAG TPA: cupredoxin domain-containing protein [Candidatus Paceibacterota bacterium]